MKDAIEHQNSCDAAKREYKAKLASLDKEYFGQCPKYKGHFDITSFFVGLATGIVSGPLIGLIARLFK